MNQEIIKKLLAPFPFEAIEAMTLTYNKDKTKGMAVFYLKSRAIQKRLDDVVGPMNWCNHFSTWHDNSQICGISIFNAERGEWITKHDGAENSDIEPIKGGLSDAFKRAAVLWGIGRYLYQIDGVWVEVEQRGKGSYIKSNQQSILKAAYDAAVKRLFPTTVQQNPSTSNAAASQPQQPVHVQSQQQPVKPSAAPTPKDTDTVKQPTTPPAQTKQTPATAAPAFDYKVNSVKPSGNGSKLLEILNSDGEILAAYIKPGDQDVEAGTHLRNVLIEEKVSPKGSKYNLLSQYEVAA